MKRRNDIIEEIIGKLAIKTKRIIIPTITMVLISSMLFGVTACSKKETYDMLQNSEAVELEIAVPEYDSNTEESQVQLLPWLQLASLETHPELRAAVEETLEITKDDQGNKTGLIYYKPYSQQTDQNQVLLGVLKNPNVSSYFRFEMDDSFATIAAENYTDVEADDPIAPYATVNAYFELLPDQTEGQFDGDATISRAQAMTLVMRAITPVNESQAPETDADFTGKVGESTYTDFAAPMNTYSYLNTSNGLTDKTFNTAMSKGEYIYMLANYFNTDYQAYADSNGYKSNIYEDDSTTISTVSDAGDISFSEAIADSSKGVPSDMYKAFQTALNMNLITESDLEDWDSAITKGEAVRLFTAMSIGYYQGPGEQVVQDIPYEEQDHPDVNPEDVDPKTTQMDADTQAALSHVEIDEIEAKYGSTEAWVKLAKSQGADCVFGWCWVYDTGKGAGNQESYAVYMKEDSPRYGEVFHLGDYLPCGQFFIGANNEEHGIADNRKLLRKSEKGELGEGTTVTQDEDGMLHIVID